ncbi:MAG: ATP phosphoribosyltransferase regulatory subunit [Clostridiales bacterium]|nr:ATP phosphoribosyltransferase regulatory subunit [Clostridiales bacterium]
MKYKSIEEELKVTKFRKVLEKKLEAYFEDRGYSFIDPKIFQNYDEFICSNYRIDSKKTVKVLSGQSDVYILRPDITMSILGKVLNKWDKDKLLKVYYNSKIYLNDESLNIGEYKQMGVESFGVDSLEADQEMIDMAIALMKQSEIPFILELGSSKYLDGYFKSLDLDQESEKKITELISKKNRNEMKNLEFRSSLMDNILDMQGDMDSVLTKAREFSLNEEMESALDELEALKDFFESNNLTTWIHFDLSMVPDLDYYDGIIFKGYYFESSKKILSGGRYDKLTEKLGKRVASIGFSIDMDELVRIKLEESER